jgi:cold shock CspA family protein
MPVQIYDIAKKLGVESKVVLAKAKELGIAAKVPSSSLDKITGEFLEQQLAACLPPPPPGAQVPQVNLAPVQANVQQVKAPGITIRASSNEIHGLLKRVLGGDIPFVLEVSQDDGSPALRAKLVPEDPPANVALKPRLEPTPRADLDEHTKRLFIGAYFYASSVSKDDGWVNLAEYGSTLKKQDPTFQAQDFGERSLGGLIRRVGIFDIKTDSNTPPVYFIRLKPQATLIQAQSVSAVPQENMQPRRHATGKIHNLKLGFGFIAPDDGSDNAFFHATEVIGCTIFDLRPGDAVGYEAGVNERGPCAWKVTRLSGNPEMRTV